MVYQKLIVSFSVAYKTLQRLMLSEENQMESSVLVGQRSDPYMVAIQ
jgi:hypothetical protein